MAEYPDHNSRLRQLLPLPQPTRTPQPVPRKRVQIKNACQSCRKRKAKCSGVKPKCFACVERDLECTYEDEDRKCRKRKHWEIEDELHTHQKLFDIIRSGREEEALDIVRRIRCGQDAHTMLRQLQNGNLLLQLSLVPETWYRYSFPLAADMPTSLGACYNPYLESLIYEQAVERPRLADADQSIANQAHCNVLVQYHIPYHAAKVVDPRLGLGKPIKWTCVSISGDLFRELLQTYFLFAYPIFPFFQKDCFLDDMVRGGRRFCSSLLVNAILVAGCQAYSRITDRTEFWNPQTLQYQFSGEARRLWELEVDSPTLTTVQAGLVMSLTCNVNGVDKVGWSYLVQVTGIAAKLHMFDSPSGTTRRRTQASIAVTAWSIFIWQSIFCFHYFRPPLRRVPPQIPLPDLRDPSAWYPEISIVYPSQQNPISVNYGAHFKAAAEFQVILNSIGASTFPSVATRARLSSAQTRHFYNSLRKWYKELPDPVSIKKVVFPWQLSLHMHYFNIIDWLMEPLRTTEEGDREAEPRVTFPVDDVGEVSAEVISLSAKTSLETIFRLYYMRHGFEVFDALLLQFHSFVGFMALKKITGEKGHSPSQLKALQSTLALAALGLRDQGKNSYLGGTIFRLLRDMAASQRALPANEITAIAEDEEDKKAQIARHVNSQFPINVVSIADDPEAQRVDSLIADYKALGLGDESDRSEGASPPGNH